MSNTGAASMTLTDLLKSHSRDNNYLFLRLLLASAVIVAHTQVAYYGHTDAELFTRLFHGLTVGDLAVNGFFIISGFLITASYVSRPQPYPFFRNRIFRICPGFILCSLICGIAFSLLQLKQGAGPNGIAPGALLATVFALRMKIPEVQLGGGVHWNWNVSIWTIPYELFCYMGVLVLGWSGMLNRRAVVAGLFLAVTVLPLGSGVGIMRPFFGGMDAFVPAAPRLAQFFLAGCCAYLYRDKIRFTPAWVALAWALVAIMVVLPKVGQSFSAFPSTYALIWAAYAPLPALNWFKGLPDFSYGTYLYGWPAGLVILWFAPALPYAAFLLLNLLLAYAGGYLSWHAVEKRFLQLAKPAPVKVLDAAGA